MTPTFEDKERGVTLYCGDCLKILPELSGIDAVVTDPPYEVRAGCGGGEFGTRDHLLKTGGFTDGGCDYSFINGFKNWMVFCSRKQLPKLIPLADTFPRWNLITWCKPNPVPTCCNKYLPDVEYVVHGFQPNRLFGEFSDKSCFKVHPCGDSETDHPNEKPVEIMHKLIRLCSQRGETLLDPYMGSGTTGIACLRTGRKFIGIEIDPKYYQIAEDRIKRELAQLVLL